MSTAFYGAKVTYSAQYSKSTPNFFKYQTNHYG